MKKFTAVFLAALILLSGCSAQGTLKENKNISSSKTVSSAVQTVDNPSGGSSSSESSSSESSSGSDSSSSSVSSKVSSSKASSSKASSSSKAASSKAESSKASSSSNTVSSNTVVQQTEPQTYTYTYEIGDTNDPIRNVDAEKVQQYIVNEPTIVSEPEPEAEFENEYEDVPVGEKVPDSWFDDCVFMGDSLSVGLSMYNDANGVFGNAKFVCASCLGYGNSQWDLYRPGNVHPYYNGRKVLLEDAVNLTGAKKAVICLGMNDIGIWGPSGVIDLARSLLYKIRAKSPNVRIYFETVSPMIYYAQKQHLNNTLIRQFNENLRQFAAEEGCGYLDSYHALADTNGNLPYDFCSDPGGLGLHLKFNGCAIWAEFIKSSIGSAYPGDEQAANSDTDTNTDADTNTDTDTEISTETDTSSATAGTDTDTSAEVVDTKTTE
ncbi:MAG: hypothetical protein IIY78_06635 [Clostridia bacterium]|nr:hypothetical protein [Clostridia bacterium]